MENPETTQKKHDLWCLAAMMAPVTQAASSSDWLAVAATGAVAVLVGGWSVPAKGWCLRLQRVFAALLVGHIMHWSTLYWQDLPFRQAVPWVLLALAVWTARVPGKGASIGCVLLWPVVFLLGAVLLSGVSEVNLEYLKPTLRLPELTLFTALLFPAFRPEGKKRGRITIATAGAVLVSVITVGVLSWGVSRSAPSGIYELSRSLPFLGIADRFESLIAAAMTMGLFISMVYLLQSEKGEEKTWVYSIIAAAWYLLAPTWSGWFYVIGGVLIWVVLPRFADAKFISKNGRKGIDKSTSS